MIEISKGLDRTPQELKKLETNAKIIKVLTDAKNRVRWKELLTETGLSSRTLTLRLKDLMEQGLVRRIVTTNIYPPAVYYEAASESYLARLPVDSALRQLLNMREERRFIQGIVKSQNLTPRELLEFMIEAYLMDFLFTLNYCIDDIEKRGKQSIWPILIASNSSCYESRLMELVRKVNQSAELKKEIKELYSTKKKERDEKNQQVIEKHVRFFNDKELAKSVLVEYGALTTLDEIKTKNEFLQRLKTDKALLKRIEKRLGKAIEKNRLEAFLLDPSWKKITLKRQPLSQIS